MIASKRLSKIAPLALAACLILALETKAADPPATAPIGVARVDITPETPVRMYGYASRKTESEGIAGQLTAKALVIGADASPGPAVLLTVDCGSVPTEIRDAVYTRVNAKTPIAPERFVLCNSHCHSGPNLKGMGSIEGVERDHLEQYAAMLTDRLVGVIEEALTHRQPASLAIARGSVAIAANRRVLTDGKWTGFGAVPDAPVDHELAVLKVTSTDGKVLAVVCNYACHNTTLRGKFKQIHGDWAGSAQKFLEADCPDTAPLITIGCGADSDPCPHGTVELCDQHGRAFADEVERLLAGPSRPIAPTVSAARQVLTVPWAKDIDMESAREVAKKSWAISSLLESLDETGKLPDPPTYPLTTWTFGDDLAMVFLSNEMVVDYAIRLKQEFEPSRLWVSAYTNDVSCYVASPRIIEEGGYEARNSLSSRVTLGQPEKLDPPMMERIVGAVKSMIPESFRKQ